MRIALKTSDGVHYLSAINGGGQGVSATPASVGDCEKFQVIGPLVFGGYVAFRTFDGSHYLSVSNRGVSADAVEVKQHEAFMVVGPNQRTDGGPVNTGDKIFLHGQHYLSTENGGEGDPTTFTVSIVESSESISSKRVIHISDPHFTDNTWVWDTEGNQIPVDTKTKGTTLANYLINNISQLGTDRVVITGDLTDSGQDGDLDVAVDFIETLRRGGFKVYSVPGNHDYSWEGILLFGDEAKRQRFISRITGYNDYPHVIPLGDTSLVLLDSLKAEMDENNYGLDWTPRWSWHPPPYLKDADQRAQGKLGDQQRADLRATLIGLQAGRRAGKKVLVCLHHSPFRTPEKNPDDDGCLDDGGDFMEVVKNNVDCLLFGHTGALQESYHTEQITWQIPIINSENLENMYPYVGVITVVDMEWERSEVYWTNHIKPLVTEGNVMPTPVPAVHVDYQIDAPRAVEPQFYAASNRDPSSGSSHSMDGFSRVIVGGVHLNALATGLRNPVTYTWIFDRGTVYERQVAGQTVDVDLDIPPPFVFDRTATVIASGGGANVERSIELTFPRPSVTVVPDYAAAWAESESLHSSRTQPVSIRMQKDGLFIQFAIIFKHVPVSVTTSGLFGTLLYNWSPPAEEQPSPGKAVYSFIAQDPSPRITGV
jgi:hypothetical protein